MPRIATPVMRPLICFRCLTFFGINMMFHHFEIRISKFEFLNLLLIVTPGSTSVWSTFATFTFAARAWTSLAFADACFVDRIRSGATGHRRFRIENLAAVNPNLYAHLSGRRSRFVETVIDVRKQRVQRKMTLKVQLTTGDYSAV